MWRSQTSWAERICLAFVDTKRLSFCLMGVRRERGERHNRMDFALRAHRPRDRAGDSEEMTIPSGRQSAGAMGVELARRAETEGFGWCRLFTHWRIPR